jgi:hypothetical protein
LSIIILFSGAGVFRAVALSRAALLVGGLFVVGFFTGGVTVFFTGGLADAALLLPEGALAGVVGFLVTGGADEVPGGLLGVGFTAAVLFFGAVFLASLFSRAMRNGSL